MGEVSEERSNIQNSFFPKEIPKLWCPLLTHYNDKGEIDKERMKKHINFLSPYISSFLVPGSTGDGWEMEDIEREKLLDFLLKEAKNQNLWIMIGVLKTARGAALNSIINTVKRYIGKETVNIDDFVKNRICGFTVTPPKGRDLSQKTIYKELENILSTGYPISLYQLPQITENEMTPKTITDLAKQYPNFYLLKDTSGEDKIALSDIKENIFMVRGAEGDYAKWLKNNKYSYDGLLLSTANCFAKEYTEIINCIQEGKVDKANKLSNKISLVVKKIFDLVENLDYGNAFTNANKLIDHHLAYGKDSLENKPPLTYSGNRLPLESLQKTKEILSENNLNKSKGYLE